MRQLTEKERLEFLEAKKDFERYLERATTASKYGERAKYQLLALESLLKKSA